MIKKFYIVLILGIFLAGMLLVHPEKSWNQKDGDEACHLEKYSKNIEDLELFLELDDAKIYRVANGYVIEKRGSRYFLNTTKVFFFNWGFIALQDVTQTRNVTQIMWRVGSLGVTNVSIQNVTSQVRVRLITGCTYNGKFLWSLELPGYVWVYERGNNRKSGVSTPNVLLASTKDYLYAFIFQTAPRSFQEFRKYAPEDTLYILGENGIVRKFNLGKGVIPLRNAFLVTNNTYALLGFERSLPDGSPYLAHLMILNGSEVIYQKTFGMSEPCLCSIIPGWGMRDENGCAIFGLYNGTATYCNGTLRLS
ncbi:hypothetical protein PNA2_0271 [Pyrococcus sp. NA2]|uniref:hypothetical protein n=1 Tax=Pyrococcus sp. (strain NA2) TaxID=342949 RepID=UPI000209B028|nr:hypothetical protein [Pyrococcus sp. NA2]AEC51189.1 hypothetical protein PNA2_0271 [Pyrococcus sp. NA2]